MLNKFLAYGTDRHCVETVMRMHAVKRWHMIDTTRQQTLAEHSANVAMLVMVIVRTAPMFFFEEVGSIVSAALTHDISEAFTGDIPSHTKKYIGGLDDLELMVTPSVFTSKVNEDSQILIKLCDLADGIRFIRLHGVDLTARHAREGIHAAYVDLIQRAIDHGWSEEIVKHVTKHTNFYAYEE